VTVVLYGARHRDSWRLRVLRQAMTRTLAVLALALVACAFPSVAFAGPDQEMILQDDPKVVHAGSDAELKETLETIKNLGTDRLRVTVFWHLLAPGATRER